jgi:hypothetical protein
MGRLKRPVMAGGIILLVTSIVAGGPNEPGKGRTQPHAPVRLTEKDGWLPGPDEICTGQSPLDECLFATYSFSNVGTTYDIEFYYRHLYSRLRVRVLAGGRELHGLLNRFYGFPAEGRCMLSVERDLHGNPTICTNFTQLVLKESTIDTDAIYDALESFLGKSGMSRG